jgi:large subunit ribosomal protein L7/L12
MQSFVFRSLGRRPSTVVDSFSYDTNFFNQLYQKPWRRPQRVGVVINGKRFSDFPAVFTHKNDVNATTIPANLSSTKLQRLYDKIVILPEGEVNVLGALIIQVLGRKIFPGEFGRGGGANSGMVASGDSDNGSDAPSESKAKTIFDVRLVGFDAKTKIKVIKEVRSITSLGLKEAKELVDSAPKVIQKDLKQEKAEEIKAQLEALGAVVELV